MPREKNATRTKCLKRVNVKADVTHGNNVLDKVFINRSDIFSTIVLCSLLKTKHSAVLVRPVIDRQICNKDVAKRSRYHYMISDSVI